MLGIGLTHPPRCQRSCFQEDVVASPASFVIAYYQIAVIVTLMSLSWGVVAGSFMVPFLIVPLVSAFTRLPNVVLVGHAFAEVGMK
jgi:hypothetical protein